MFYTSLFFGHAATDIVSENMYHKLCEDGLPVDRICTLVRDGPNVNKAIFQKMNELVLWDFPAYLGLVDIGSCSIHVIQNAFGKDLEHYGKDVDQLCLDLYSLFKYSAARREDFKEVQEEIELDTNNFLQHTEVRWLSIGPSIKRILEQWDAITHFVAELAKDSKKVPKSINFKRIYTMLGTKEKQTTRVTSEFLSNVIPVFEKF